MTKATDISKNYIFEKPLKNGCRNMCHTLIFVLNKTKIFLTFFWHFFQPSLAHKKVIDLIFFFKYIDIHIDSRPPSLYRLKGCNLPFLVCGDDWLRMLNMLKIRYWCKPVEYIKFAHA